jgi:hypothetical protein
VEGDEAVIVTLAAGSGYEVDADRSAGVAVIKDQTYGTPVVSAVATDATATEPGVATDKGAIKISRTGSCDKALTVQCSMGGTAANGVDYLKVTTPVVLAAGQSSKVITIAPLADGVVEGAETAVLTITADTAYQIAAGQGSATVTIKDNTLLATPTVSVVATDADAAEPNGTVNTGTLEFSRTSRFHEALVVKYAVSGTAENGTDYVKLSGTVTIPAGQATRTVVVTPKADGVTEGSETVVVTVSASGSYVVDSGKSSATMAIRD